MQWQAPGSQERRPGHGKRAQRSLTRASTWLCWSSRCNRLTEPSFASLNSRASCPKVIDTFQGNIYTETSGTDPQCPSPASYTWSYDGQNLIYHLVGEDACDPRRNAYDGQKYVKQTPSPLAGSFATEDGSWVLSFSEYYSYTYTVDGAVETAGLYSIKDNELIWLTNSHCDRRMAGVAIYIWTLQDDTLVFHVKGDDRCQDRLTTLDDVSWYREP